MSELLKVNDAVRRLSEIKSRNYDFTPEWPGDTLVYSDGFKSALFYDEDARADFETLHRALDALVMFLIDSTGAANDVDMRCAPDEPASWEGARTIVEAILKEETKWL
ncbi:hypothetical protein [Paramicrobacterium agarici]|uniref:hypothetical protein n=1 Tax=Paramicrobacterium agarici TaxID=630514 RepID=UPI00114EAAFD|nr:hypothetical protein [Microbacterium agarici]TQO23820.1 hypothetical protein FB385_2682 [Microbacterium agarici]